MPRNHTRGVVDNLLKLIKLITTYKISDKSKKLLYSNYLGIPTHRIWTFFIIFTIPLIFVEIPITMLLMITSSILFFTIHSYFINPKDLKKRLIESFTINEQEKSIELHTINSSVILNFDMVRIRFSDASNKYIIESIKAKRDEYYYIYLEDDKLLNWFNSLSGKNKRREKHYKKYPSKRNNYLQQSV